MAAFFIDEDDIPEIKRNPWIDHFFRPLLIVAMIMCLNLALVNLVRLVNPAWSGTYFLLGMLLTAVEGIYSVRVVRRWRLRGSDLVRYRLAEAVILVILLKLLNFADKSPARIWAELQAIWNHPANILTVEFYLVLALAMLSWVAATFTLEDFEALYDPYTFRGDSVVPLNDLLTRFYWGGLLLLFITGLTQVISRAGVEGLADFQRRPLGGIFGSVLLYFMLGLVLLSQANLTRLLVRWRVQKLDVTPGLLGQWAKYAFIFLALLAALVFLLPTGYTQGFLATAALGVAFLLNLLVFLTQLALFLIALPIAWLMSLFSDQAGPPPAPPPPLLLPEFEPSAGSAPSPWLALIRSLIFWLITLAMVGYLLHSYLSEQRATIYALRRFRLVRWLLTAWHWLRGRVIDLTESGLAWLPQRGASADPGGPNGEARRGWLRLRLSPRERVLRYYRNILRRVGEQGHGRQESETAYEYEPNLEQSVPRAKTEVKEVTEAFVQARYSPAPVSDQDAQSVKNQWQQIKRGLRRPRHDPPAGDQE